MDRPLVEVLSATANPEINSEKGIVARAVPQPYSGLAGGVPIPSDHGALVPGTSG
jgi:hypothetical protein